MKLTTLDLATVRPGSPEIFASIQGEGPQQGRPRVFVRLSRCNLYCRWCDTPYTWNWTGTAFAHDEPTKYDRSANSVQLSVDDVRAKVEAMPNWPVVITGGEPMLQQRALTELARGLSGAHGPRRIEVETNGTITPDADFDAVVSLYVVSPKLANSAVPARLRWRPEATGFFSRSDRACFKLVVSADGDVDEVLGFVRDANVAPERIYLMPEAADAAALKRRAAQVADLCARHGFAYSDRLHLRLFGAERGV